MKALEGTLFILMLVGTYGSPVIALAIWVKRLRSWSKESRGWREWTLWIAVLLATVSVAFFWSCYIFAPGRYPTRDMWIRSWSRASLIIAGLALVLAILGRGKARWATVLLASSVPVSWATAATLE